MVEQHRLHMAETKLHCQCGKIKLNSSCHALCKVFLNDKLMETEQGRESAVFATDGSVGSSGHTDLILSHIQLVQFFVQIKLLNSLIVSLSI